MINIIYRLLPFIEIENPMNKILDSVIKLFDKLEERWHGNITPKVISTLLIIVFFLGIILIELDRFGQWPGWLKNYGFNHYLAIDLAFTVLLLFEIVGLVFVLPRSVADSVGKQFEILSIILLRSAFKEFGSLNEPISWDTVSVQPLFHMVSDAFGALIIFFIIGFYYRAQKHQQITSSEDEQDRFIRMKKYLAIALLLVFFILGINDLNVLFTQGYYKSSFNIFYTVLIFADILILLYSLRYTTRYSNIFRYSSFALATVLIRLSLTAPAYINAGLGIVAGLFVLGITYAYNKFRSENIGTEKF